jgi:hypothetical protein
MIFRNRFGIQMIFTLDSNVPAGKGGFMPGLQALTADIDGRRDYRPLSMQFALGSRFMILL